MMEINLADGTRREFEAVFVSKEPLLVGHEIDSPATTWRVVECLPRQAGGYFVGVESAVMHVCTIDGKRL
jgi:hypothetical protein